MDLKGKKAIVVGAGKSGVSAARFLAMNGADVVLNDVKEIAGLEEVEAEGVRLAGGWHEAALFDEKELIVISPGVPGDLPPLKGILDSASKRGVEVISEIELGARFVHVPVIAVTGTNGKSTTVTLIGDMLEAGGKKVFTGGNLGTPFTEFLLEDKAVDYLVLEVSSFQLERIETFRPFIGIYLNLTPDHLDRYPSMEAYGSAKKRIFMNQEKGDYALINGDDPALLALAGELKAKTVPFGSKGNAGISIDDGCIVSTIPGAEGEMGEACLDRVGRHNAENVMAAFGAALICGIGDEAILEGLEKFSALPHRMEYAGEAGGVRFYDDSKATNVGAVVRSLESISSPVILIAGGKDKGGSYGPLSGPVKEKVKGLVLMGEAAGRIKEELGKVSPTYMAADMEGAVEQAWHLAESGDVVLLSPACSSFDMFDDYGQRGRVFQSVVEEIIARGNGTGKEAALAG